MRITIKGSMVGYHFDHMPEGAISWGFSDVPGYTVGGNIVAVFPYEFDVVVPDNINVTAALVKNIEAQKLAALEAYQRTVAECNERLSKLQAITCEVAA